MGKPQNGLPWQMETWTEACGFDPQPTLGFSPGTLPAPQRPGDLQEPARCARDVLEVRAMEALDRHYPGPPGTQQGVYIYIYMYICIYMSICTYIYIYEPLWI